MQNPHSLGSESANYMVKGSTIRSKFDFVRELAGDDAERQFRAEFERESTILDSAWYSFQLYDDVNGKLARVYLGGNESRLDEVGRYSADRALSGVYKTFLSSRSFERFLERIASLHDLMYSEGKVTVEFDLEHRSCRIVHGGAPVYSPRDLYIAQGFYARAGELFQVQGVRCRFRQMPDGPVFELTWN